jgi:hypothetical protein
MFLQDKRVDPFSRNCYLIKLASRNGHTKIEKMLLQDPRVAYFSNKAM